MAVAALLARITAHGPALIRMPPGGVPELTGEDIALALAQAPARSVWLLRAKYMDDLTGLARLESALYQRAVPIAEGWRGWSVDDTDSRRLLGSLCRAAIVEVMDPALCRTCQGRGHVLSGGLLKNCTPCHGSGRGRRKEAERARLVGVQYDAWRKTWSTRLDRLTGIVEGWESAGLGAIAAVVYGEVA